MGNRVTGGTEDATLLTTVVSVDPIHVYVNADERAYLRYQRLAQAGARPSSRERQNPVRLQLADEEGFPRLGYMDFVDNRLDAATGTIQGPAVLLNPDDVLVPGVRSGRAAVRRRQRLPGDPHQPETTGDAR